MDIAWEAEREKGEYIVAALQTDIRLEIWAWIKLFHNALMLYSFLYSTATCSYQSGVILF